MSIQEACYLFFNIQIHKMYQVFKMIWKKILIKDIAEKLYSNSHDKDIKILYSQLEKVKNYRKIKL